MTTDLNAATAITDEERPTVVRDLLVFAGVPPRFTDRRLEGFEPRKGTASAIAGALAMLAGDREGLILSGGPGAGKTHIAVGILASRLDAWLTGYPRAWWEMTEDVEPDAPPTIAVVRRPPLDVRFLVVPTFLDRLRSAIRFADHDDPLPTLFDVDLLVLDDLGREKVTDWASERLYVLVNERYNRRRPTIVTTNYSPDELADRGYDALVSRLVEGAAVVLLTADDYRSGVGR